jgi:hypothetical protein
MEAWILRRAIERSRALIAKSEELDQEANHLSEKIVELVHEIHDDEKWKRDFEIQLLRDVIEKRKNYPLGVPQGPSPEQH